MRLELNTPAAPNLLGVEKFPSNPLTARISFNKLKPPVSISDVSLSKRRRREFIRLLVRPAKGANGVWRTRAHARTHAEASTCVVDLTVQPVLHYPVNYQKNLDDVSSSAMSRTITLGTITAIVALSSYRGSNLHAGVKRVRH